jgi:hypothetical protein
MEKCVFVGYPAGYKGWKFYNPVTRKFIISERADFDERYFPGLKTSFIQSIPSPSSFTPVDATDMPDLGGNDTPTNLASPPSISSTVVRLPISIDQNDNTPLSSLSQNIPQDPVPQLQDQVPSSLSPVPHHIPLSPLLIPTSPVTSSPALSSLPLDQPPTPPLALRRSRRNIQPPRQWWKVTHTPPPESDSSEDEHDIEFAGLANLEPTFNQAMKSPEAESWKTACQEELDSLHANGTWDIVPLPPNKKPIGCKWVFKLKRHADGSIERYKARLVAKGFSQKPGVDYNEVFAPTFRMASIRTILALAALNDYHLRSIDISTAFLNGDLEEDIYMQQPPGFEQFGPEYVCKLNKSLYGLKQAARQWNKKLHSTLLSLDYKRLESDRSVYIYAKNGILVLIPIFIDDITLASNSQTTLDNTVEELASHFKLRDLGETSFLLGIKITRDIPNHSISLSQHQYIVDMLDKYGFSTCTSISTPMDPGLQLTKTTTLSTEDKEFMSKVPYISAVGSLMYLAHSTRPDITYAVGVLARYSSNPSPIHWKAVKHLFRYLQGTKDYQLVYKPSDCKELFVTYSDANHGGCKDSAKSTGGYVIMVGTGAVSWSSKLQSMVTLSTTEAEYIAAVEAGKEIVWMRSILQEFGYKFDSGSTLYMDNQSAINVSKNPEHHGRMKHLDLRHHWLRDKVEAGVIIPKHVGTGDMVADCLTKALARIKHDKCRIGLGLVE